MLARRHGRDRRAGAPRDTTRPKALASGLFMPKTGIPLVMLSKATGYREIIRFLDDRGTSLLKGKGDAQRELAAKL